MLRSWGRGRGWRNDGGCLGSRTSPGGPASPELYHGVVSGLPLKQQQRRKLRPRGSRSSSGSERPRTDPSYDHPGQPRTLGRHGFQRAPASLSWETLSLLWVPLGKQGAELGGKKPGFGLCRVTVTRAPETLSPPTLGVCICETEITIY